MKIYLVKNIPLPEGDAYYSKVCYASLDDAELAVARITAQLIQDEETDYYSHKIECFELVGAGFKKST
jgi:hypothetical protein